MDNVDEEELHIFEGKQLHFIILNLHVFSFYHFGVKWKMYIIMTIFWTSLLFVS